MGYPIAEDEIYMDPIEFHPEGKPYRDRFHPYQRKTGITKVVHTGIDQLNGISIFVIVI